MASIRKRGDSYQITVSNGRDSSGKQLIETATFTPDPNKTEKQNQKALEKFVFEFEEKVKSGKYLDGEKITFKDFSDQYIEEYALQHLEAKTIASYRDLLRLHILPAIGHLKLAKIQPQHLNTLYIKLSKERKDGRPGGYAPKTIKHIHSLISSIYSLAVKWNTVSDNPCDRVSPPKQIKGKDIKYFTLEQAEAFLEALNHEFLIPVKAHDRIDDTGRPYHVDAYMEKKTLPLQYKVFFNLALFCGMRRGELIALEWSDFDFINNTVSISKSTVLVNGKPITKTPKTESSIRVISVPASVISILKGYRKEQLELRLKLGDAWEGKNYVFIQWNGKQMYPDTPYSTFKDIIRWYNSSVKEESQKLPDIPLHGLRHTSATLLISQNIDVRTVSGRLGHSQTSTTTDIYSHFLKRADEAASNTLESLFSEPNKTLVKC